MPAAYIQMYFKLVFIMEANTMNPDDADESSLIGICIVCNIGFQNKPSNEHGWKRVKR